MKIKRNAFSLPELVIVIIIISVIAAFALPNYFRGLAKQKERNAASNIRQLALGAQNWQAATSSGVFNSSNINQINATLGTDVMLDDDEGVSVGIQQGQYLLSITWSSGGTIVGLGDTGGTVWDEPCCSTNNCIILPDCS